MVTRTVDNWLDMQRFRGVCGESGVVIGIEGERDIEKKG